MGYYFDLVVSAFDCVVSRTVSQLDCVVSRTVSQLDCIVSRTRERVFAYDLAVCVSTWYRIIVNM